MSDDRFAFLHARIQAIVDLPSDRFDDLVNAAGLNPRKDLRFGDWQGLDLRGTDLRGFDFTGANLIGARFDGAQVAGAIFERASVDLEALRKATDFEVFAYKSDHSIHASPGQDAHHEAKPEGFDRSPEIIDLFEANDDFEWSTYVREFAPYRWTYIAGFAELISLLHTTEPEFSDVSSVVDYLTGLRLSGVRRVPNAWKQSFTGGYWSNCGADQIELACSGAPLRFDRACQAIKTLEFAFSKATMPVPQNLNIYNFIRLRPAIYVLEDMPARCQSLLRGKEPGQRAANDLASKLFLSPLYVNDPSSVDHMSAFLSGAADGFAMTWANAKRTTDFVEDVSGTRVRIEGLRRRKSVTQNDREGRFGRMGRKMCNPWERPFITIHSEPSPLFPELRKASDNWPE
jgi:hypothetical protein